MPNQTQEINLAKMTEHEALDILDNVAGKVNMQRDGHDAVLLAVGKLRKFIEAHVGPKAQIKGKKK